MVKRDFDRDLDVYLSARKRGKPFSFKEFFAKLVPKKDEVIDKDAPFYHEVDKVPKEKKKTAPEWFKKIFSIKLPKKKKQEEDADIEYKLLAEDAVADLKKVTKIALEAIKELPPEKIREFKEREEFAKLKKILKKHELIK